jgi:hypothetical protein
MALATDEQVQQFANERVRPFSERFRAVLLEAEDHKAAIDDIYAALTQPNPTWTDERTDAPPTLLTKDTVLAWNAFVSDFITFARGNGNLAAVLDACVQPVRL